MPIEAFRKLRVARIRCMYTTELLATSSHRWRASSTALPRPVGKLQFSSVSFRFDGVIILLIIKPTSVCSSNNIASLDMNFIIIISWFLI